MRLFSSSFRLLYCVMATGLCRVVKATWSGELSDNYTATISMSTATTEEEIVGVSVRLNHAMRQ